MVHFQLQIRVVVMYFQAKQGNYRFAVHIPSNYLELTEHPFHSAFSHHFDNYADNELKRLCFQPLQQALAGIYPSPNYLYLLPELN